MFKKNHPQGWFFSVQHHFYWSDNLQYPKSTKTRYFRRNNGFLWSMRPGSNRRPAAGLNKVSRQWRCPQRQPPVASYSYTSCCPILSTGHMAQPGTDQHQSRIPVRETTHHTGTAADLWFSCSIPLRTSGLLLLHPLRPNPGKQIIL